MNLLPDAPEVASSATNWPCVKPELTHDAAVTMSSASHLIAAAPFVIATAVSSIMRAKLPQNVSPLLPLGVATTLYNLLPIVTLESIAWLGLISPLPA